MQAVVSGRRCAGNMAMPPSCDKRIRTVRFVRIWRVHARGGFAATRPARQRNPPPVNETGISFSRERKLESPDCPMRTLKREHPHSRAVFDFQVVIRRLSISQLSPLKMPLTRSDRRITRHLIELHLSRLSLATFQRKSGICKTMEGKLMKFSAELSEEVCCAFSRCVPAAAGWVSMMAAPSRKTARRTRSP